MRTTENPSALAKLSFILSTIALLVSFWSSFSPANVEVAVNSPVWIARGAALGIKLTCVFANSGARTGIINDILLKMEGKDGTSAFLFFPVTVIDETQFTLEAKPDVKFVKGPFYPIGVQGKQTLVLSFIFIQYTNNPNFKSAKIDPQEYKLTVLTRSGTFKTYDLQQSLTVNLEQGALDTLRQGTMVQVNSDLDKPRDLVK